LKDCSALGRLIDKREEILTSPRLEGKMRGMTKSEIAPIVICQNAREEFHLDLMQGNGRKYIELRTCIRDPERGKANPIDNSITVNLELWPLFIAAISSFETWTYPLELWSQQQTREFGRDKLLFPEEVLRNNPQEQIFLEARNFQGIPFISLKTLANNTKGRRLYLVTIGPIIWSQFMWCLKNMEKALLDFGWLAGTREWRK
jgi:hypothetical protein